MAETTILQAVPHLDTGGSEQATLEITDALTRAGAKALIVTEGGRLATAIKDAGGEIIPLPMASKNPATILANARRLAAIVKSRNVALLHARSRAPAWSSFFASRRTGLPFVTTYHGAYSGRAPLKTLYNSVMARGDRVIANSRYTAALVASRHSVPPERMHIIYRGIDLSRFEPGAIAPARLERLRAAWRVREGCPIVLHAARLTRWKGQSHTIEAVRALRAANRLGDTVVILAGDDQGRDSYREALEQQIRDAGLDDCVRLVGHCDDIPAAFNLATVALVPSIRAETFGRTSIESQAAGCPVIVADVGAAPENIIPASSSGDFTGWVVSRADSEALTACLSEVLALPAEALQAIGERARAHAKSRFALQNMQRATLAVYDTLLGTTLAARFS